MARRTVTMYYLPPRRTPGDAVDEVGERILRRISEDWWRALADVAAFVPRLEALTGYRVRLRRAGRRVLRGRALAMLTSKAFVFGEDSVFFSPLFASRGTLLHEVGHVEEGRRFGALIPRHRRFDPYSSDDLIRLKGDDFARLKDSLVACAVSEAVADALVFGWSRGHFRAMVEKRRRDIRDGPPIVAGELAARYLIEEEMLRQLSREHRVGFGGAVRDYGRVNDAFLGRFPRGVGAAVRSVVRRGVATAIGIVELGDRDAAQRLLRGYVRAAERGIRIPARR